MAEFTKVTEISRQPISSPKKKRASNLDQGFNSVQRRQLEADWDDSLEMPSYSNIMAERAVANLLGNEGQTSYSISTQNQQEYLTEESAFQTKIAVNHNSSSKIHKQEADQSTLHKDSRSNTQEPRSILSPKREANLLATRILFDSCDTDLSTESISALDNLLNQYIDYAVGKKVVVSLYIYGYADPRGDTQDNLLLSEYRAKVVGLYLRECIEGYTRNLVIKEIKGLGERGPEGENDIDTLSVFRRVDVFAQSPVGITSIEATNDESVESYGLDKHYQHKEEKFSIELFSVNGKLYVADLDEEDIDVNDIKQNNIGDCYFLASLAAFVNARPQALKDMITDHKNGEYTVILHKFVKAKDGRIAAQDVSVKVSNVLPILKNERSKGLYGADIFEDDQIELWVAIVEKAFLTLESKGSRYNTKKMKYGAPESALESLTGTDANTHLLSSGLFSSSEIVKSDDTLLAHLYSCFQQKRPMVASISPHGGLYYDELNQKIYDKNEKKGLSQRQRESLVLVEIASGHSYAIISVDHESRTVDLYEPAKHQHLYSFPISFLRTHFAEIAISNLK